MGKISPPSIKYIVKIKFETEGIVEKPDIIGAIFGQTEGLLGEDLELRDLQKKGKIGRIDVSIEENESKTTGIIEIPTSIDKAETSIIAAAVETIDRVGPTNAKFEILGIDDVRTSKREYILERAKKLMEKLQEKGPESGAMEQQVMDHTKTAKIQEYGAEFLAAGPNIDSSNEIIVVEGRADVLNLLRAGIKNAIAMNGTMLPKTIKELSKEKQVTLFVDGDRGGILIAKDAVSTANILYIARAPDGKEVEELADKEINLCLRARMSVDEFKKKYFNGNGNNENRERETYKQEKEELSDEEKEFLKDYFETIRGSNDAAVFLEERNKINLLKRTSADDLPSYLYRLSRKQARIFAIAIDDTATRSLISVAEQLGCKAIVAKNFASTSQFIELLSF
jgi:DNA primase